MIETNAIKVEKMEESDGDRLTRLVAVTRAAACDRLVRGEDRGVCLDLQVWRRGNVVFWAL